MYLICPKKSPSHREKTDAQTKSLDFSDFIMNLTSLSEPLLTGSTEAERRHSSDSSSWTRLVSDEQSDGVTTHHILTYLMSTLESGVVFSPRGVDVESAMMSALLWEFTGMCGVFKHSAYRLDGTIRVDFLPGSSCPVQLDRSKIDQSSILRSKISSCSRNHVRAESRAYI